MASMFKKATKAKLKARVAITGPSGSGKTYTALVFARALGSRVAVIDTERGSASKYVGDLGEFDALELETFEPKRYVAAIAAAAAEGYDVLVIDSLSHAWFGNGGILDQKDKKGGDFGVWRQLTPEHNKLVDAILAFPGHVVATMRSKTEYSVDKDAKTGKTTVRKVGTAPIQRDGVEYEFDLVADMDMDHVLHVTKSRCSALAGRDIREPGAEVAEELLAWLDDGVERAGSAATSARASDTKKAPAAPAARLSDCADEAALMAWARANASRVTDRTRASMRDALREACGRLEVDVFPVLEAAGLADAPLADDVRDAELEASS